MSLSSNAGTPIDRVLPLYAEDDAGFLEPIRPRASHLYRSAQKLGDRIRREALID